MKPMRLLFATAAIMTASFACVPKQETIIMSLQNNLELARHEETVEVSISDLHDLSPELNMDSIILIYRKSGETLPHQIIDRDNDGANDIIIFQPDIASNSKVEIVVRNRGGGIDFAEPEYSTFSRFVPERIDDYAWENDRVAFRMYGPEAQRLTEAGDPGGTLSSGIDCWLKRVQYPIINKWYKKAADGTGTYHEDTGEGLDNYHVGPSRGCGGTGIWADQALYTSKNFIDWERIAIGPIRTSFVLTYGPWEALGRTIHEEKHISLDLGSNLSRIEMHIESDPPIEEVTIGIAMHNSNGMAGISEEEGWFNYWQPHEGSFLGTAVVIDPATVTGYTEYLTEEKDKSHLYIHAKPTDDKLVYYTGFFWQKSGQFADNDAWQTYLSNFSKKLRSPIVVQLRKE